MLGREPVLDRDDDRIGSGRQGMEGLDKGDRRYAGDFGTPEQKIPATGLPGVDWESCMTMNDTWGYKRDDQHWKTAEMLIRNLVDIASKGGNYLLNVGPTAAGEIPAPSLERLARIGQWMKVNGASIYGTQASPIGLPGWGRCTRKSLGGGNTRLYLHVLDWPADGKLVVPGLNRPVQRAYLLADPDEAALACVARDEAVQVQVPAAAPDPVCSVVVLDLAGPGPAVPTWNYVAVHAYGTPRLVEDAAETRAHRSEERRVGKEGRSRWSP